MTNQENRVIARSGARELTHNELEKVAAAGGPVRTLTPCVVMKENNVMVAGDINEC